MNPAIESLHYHFNKHPVVTTDSRNVPEQSIFFALKGENFDGNKFAQMALYKGAALAVVDDVSFKGKNRFLVVDDVLKTLQEFASYYRNTLEVTVIGITGSNGKTTTKELIHAVLSEKYKCKATEGNFNNHIGVPLTLLSLTNTLDFAVVEMGANHIGEIAELSAIANPDYGLITNVGKAHLEGFGSFEGVIEAKTELYKYLENTGGKVFVKDSDKILQDKAKHIESIAYGTGSPVHAKITKSFPVLKLSCNIYNEQFEISTNLVGSYNLENILAAVAVGHYFGVKSHHIKAAIEGYMPVNNRSQILRTTKNILVMDAYNANPSSMEVAINNFVAGNTRDKVLILGEMLELGDVSEEEHSKLVKMVMELNPETAYFVGKSFGQLYLPYKNIFSSKDALIEHLKKFPLRHKTILIKGSRGNKLEDIVDLL